MYFKSGLTDKEIYLKVHIIYIAQMEIINNLNYSNYLTWTQGNKKYLSCQQIFCQQIQEWKLNSHLIFGF